MSNLFLDTNILMEILFQSFDDYDQNDFEDWLQINTCLFCDIANFLILDKKLAKKHSKKLNIMLL